MKCMVIHSADYNRSLQVFTMTNVDEDATKKNPFPCPTTYRTALTHYVDITALPRTHILKVE